MEHYNEPWEMLADQKIWSMLADTDRKITNDYVRLLFIELLSRIRKLETESRAMQVVLLETDLISEEDYNRVLDLVKEFIANHDEKKAKEVELFSHSGISFVDWVNFITKGQFQTPS